MNSIFPRKINLFGFDGDIAAPPHNVKQIPAGIKTLLWGDIFNADLVIFAPNLDLFCPPQEDKERCDLTWFLRTRHSSEVDHNTYQSWLPEKLARPLSLDYECMPQDALTPNDLAEYGLWQLDQVFRYGNMSPLRLVVFLPREAPESGCTAPIWSRWMGLFRPHKCAGACDNPRLTREAEQSWLARVLNPADLVGNHPIKNEPVKKHEITYGLNYSYYRFDDSLCRRGIESDDEFDEVSKRIARNTQALLAFPWDLNPHPRARPVVVTPLVIWPPHNEVLGVQLRIDQLEVYLLPEMSDMNLVARKVIEEFYGVASDASAEAPSTRLHKKRVAAGKEKRVIKTRRDREVVRKEFAHLRESCGMSKQGAYEEISDKARTGRLRVGKLSIPYSDMTVNVVRRTVESTD
jgi:hypothetical protein